MDGEKQWRMTGQARQKRGEKRVSEQEKEGGVEHKDRIQGRSHLCLRTEVVGNDGKALEILLKVS